MARGDMRYAGPSAQALAVRETDNLTVYYSYTTPIGFQYLDSGFVTKQKYSVTTSKHTTRAIRHIGPCELVSEKELRIRLDMARKGNQLATAPSFALADYLTGLGEETKAASLLTV